MTAEFAKHTPPAGPSTSFSDGSHERLAPQSWQMDERDVHVGEIANPHAAVNGTQPANKGATRSTVDGDAADVRPKKRKLRNSGGFLLNGLLSRSSSQSSNLSIAHEVGGTPKKLGSRQISQASPAASRHTHASGHDGDHPLGGSPLSKEVQNVSIEAPRTNGHVHSQHSSSPTLGSVHSTGSDANTSGESTLAAKSNGLRTPQVNHPGTFSDPNQIISLALSLNESRRHSSAYPPSPEYHGGRRISSYGHPPVGPQYNPRDNSLRQYLEQQRRQSLGVVARQPSDALRVPQASSPMTYDGFPAQKRFSSQSPDLATAEDGVFNFSPATLKRAEKAREWIELSHEYRRLLQYLPPLPVRSKANFLEKNGSVSSREHLGRAYNPLQYIRNRRVRLRERKPINAEAEGWKNLDRVRAWVDLVQSQRDDGISRSDNPYPLPPLDVVETESEEGPTEDEKKAIKPPGRPEYDWLVKPFDILGDAFWLEEGENKYRIEDANGDPIFTHSKASKDRPAPHSRPSELRSRRNSMASAPRRSLEAPKTSTANQKTKVSMHRRNSESGSPEEDISRKGRWPARFIRSREPSLSSDSDWDRQSRLERRKRTTRADLDHIALEKQMKERLAKEQAQTNAESPPPNVPPSKEEGTIPNGLERTLTSIPLRRTRPSAPRRLQTDIPLSTQSTHRDASRQGERKQGHSRLSSSDIDSTRPNSPTTSPFVPSIAVNFSPPASPRERSTSPKKRGLPKWAALGRARSHSSSGRLLVKRNPNLDGSKTSLLSRSRTHETLDRPPTNEENLVGGRNLQSPFKSINATSSRREQKWPRRGSKDSSEEDDGIAEVHKRSKLGILRIKKDAAPSAPKNADNPLEASVDGSSPSSRGFLESDVDDGAVSGLDASPNDLSRVTTSEGYGGLSRVSTNSEKPKYFNENLPSFRSRSDREEQNVRSPAASPWLRPIPEGRKGVDRDGRRNRFDLLAPPRVNGRGNASLVSDRGEESDSASRTSSVRRSSSRTTSQHRLLNDMLGNPGQIRSMPRAPLMTGLAQYDAKPPSAKKGRPMPHSDLQLPDRDLFRGDAALARKDVARVRALFISSGVKANEWHRRANVVPDQAPQILHDLQDVLPEDLPRPSLNSENVVAARLLVGAMDLQRTQLQDGESRFTNILVDDLSREIGTLSVRLRDSLSPLVHRSGDEADDFNSELVSKQALAMKGLNNQISRILRRRRRRFRWLRSGAWAMIEWVVLSLLWMVWFVAVIVRMVRYTAFGFVGVIKWLLWL